MAVNFEMTHCSAAGVGQDACLRVLVADDHPASRQLARAILEFRGHCVTLAVDGRAVVQAACAGRFDVILMDARMPVMDGVAATREIRFIEDGAGRRTPIVALTGCAMRAEIDELLACGMDACVVKPYSPSMLLQVVEEVAARDGRCRR